MSQFYDLPVYANGSNSSPAFTVIDNASHSEHDDQADGKSKKQSSETVKPTNQASERPR